MNHPFTVVAALLTAAGHLAAAQSVRIDWREGARLPLPKAGHATGWVDGKLVLAGGSHWPDQDTKVRAAQVDAYDPATDSWSRLTDLPRIMASCGGAMVGDDFYVLGGFDGNEPVLDCYKFRPEQGDGGAWERIAPLPSPRVLGAVAVWRTRIYICGGTARSDTLADITNSLIYLDTANLDQGWRPAAPLPGRERCIFTGAAAGDGLYFFGGAYKDADGVFNVSEAWRYAPETDAWTPLRPAPLRARGWAATALDDRRILLFGGYQGAPRAGFIPDVWLYDTELDLYHKVGEMPHAIGVTEFMRMGDTVYAAGGEDAPKSRAPWCLIGKITPVPRRAWVPDLKAGALPDTWESDTGVWELGDGTIEQTDTRPHPATLFFTDRMYSDVDLTVSWKVEKPGGHIWAVDPIVRAADSSRFYYFHFDAENDMVAFARSVPGRFWTEPKRFLKIGNTVGSWHESRIVVSGNTLTVYFDGQRIGQVKHDALKAGAVGLATASAAVTFRDLRVVGTESPDSRPFGQGPAQHVPLRIKQQLTETPAVMRIGDELLCAVAAAQGLQFLASTDGGLTWTSRGSFTAPGAGAATLVDAGGARAACLFVNKATGVLDVTASSDGGRSWTSLPGPEMTVTPCPGPLPVWVDQAHGAVLAAADKPPTALRIDEAAWSARKPSEADAAAATAWRRGVDFWKDAHARSVPIDADESLLIIETRGALQAVRSADAGRRWQGPIVVAAQARGPAGITRRADGRILVSYRSPSGRPMLTLLDLDGEQVRPAVIGVPADRPVPASPAPGDADRGGIVVCPVTAVNERNTEASVVALEDGRLLMAYSRFYGGGGDHDWCDISGRTSEDGGRTWSSPSVLVRNLGDMNVMSATLLRLQSGKLLLGYLRKNSTSDCRMYVRLSADEGAAWSDEVLATAAQVYHVVNNDRVIQLASGRLLVPAADHDAWKRGALAVCYYSDDEARTWQRAPGEVKLSGVGCQEPGLVEVKDGRVLMIIRTSLGAVYKAVSSDAGMTWSTPVSTGLRSPAAPSTVKRLPTGDLLMVWNNSPTARRVPLTTAVSTDEGDTWTHVRDLEPTGGSFAYTSVTFVDTTAVMTYWTAGAGGLALKVRRVPVQWFYGE